jgi:hypothetical protein
MKISKKLLLISLASVALITGASCATPLIVKSMRNVGAYPTAVELSSLITDDGTTGGTCVVTDNYKKSPSEATLFSALKKNVKDAFASTELYVNELILGPENSIASKYGCSFSRQITIKTNSLLYKNSSSTDIYVYYSYSDLIPLDNDITETDLSKEDDLIGEYVFPSEPDYKEVFKRVLQVTSAPGVYPNSSTYINQLQLLTQAQVNVLIVNGDASTTDVPFNNDAGYGYCYVTAIKNSSIYEQFDDSLMTPGTYVKLT